MEKILNDRINELRSRLQDAENPKLSRVFDQKLIDSLESRLMEVQVIRAKFRTMINAIK